MKFVLALIFTTLLVKGQGQQLVLPGAAPDPSAVKIGNGFWATATSSNWFPAFPILYSKDLIAWEQKGYIFNKIPAWADYYFWAPEISYDSGRVYVYYTAHKKDGNLCVGVASADRPEGPYRDHGPLVCQEVGSIDPFPIRDTAGKLYLVWKEDANSVGRPTPIWAQEMNEQRTALVGERRELFRNDAKWEKELVEGVSILKHNDYYYALYAAAGCCGDRCTYLTGVARARDVLGPWEKYNKNPILTDTGNWICKGHGTPIEKNSKFYFLYHGYDRVTSAFTGREALLQEFFFTADQWIKFINHSTDSIARNENIHDEFDKPKLELGWQWSVFDTFRYRLKNDLLYIGASPKHAGSFIAQKIVSADYTATTVLLTKTSTALSGIGAIGDEDNVIALLCKNNQLQILKVEDGKDSVLSTFRINPTEKLYLQMRVRGPYRISFFYSYDGKNFVLLNLKAIRGAFLPPWDSPPRVGLLAKGQEHQKAIFENFEIRAGALPPDEGKADLAIQIIALVVLSGLTIWFFLNAYGRKVKKTNPSVGRRWVGKE
jgi:beta-xylosidase